MVDDEIQETELAAPVEEGAEAEGLSGENEELQEELEQLMGAAEGVAEAATAASTATPGSDEPKTLDLILDVTLAVTIEVGRARMTIQDLLQLGQGSVVELEKLAGEPLDVFINGKRVATGEAVIVNEKFGVRLKDIISPEERLTSLGG